MMTETKKCIKCGEEYEPKYYDLLNTKILRGAGNCPKCAKKIWEDEEAKEKADLLARINETKTHYILNSGIPGKFRSATFNSFDKGWQDKAKDYCEKYAQIFPADQRPRGYPSLYLWSAKDWGTGKTHLSCAIALSIINRWAGEGTCPQIRFISEYDLFRSIQATFNYNREEGQFKDSEAKIIKDLTYCDLLVLDDVGKQTNLKPDFVQRILFSLIDGRYKLQLPIILTANINADGLKRHLGGASLDRFFEMTGGKSACMDGNSYRRKK